MPPTLDHAAGRDAPAGRGHHTGLDDHAGLDHHANGILLERDGPLVAVAPVAGPALAPVPDPLRLLSVRPPAAASWRAKRIFDVAVSSLLLILLSPVLLAAAVGAKLSSRGPALFRQARVGHLGVEFTMYKFRTFPVEHVDDTFSLEHHQCPLRLGRFLRRTSIDELPQLFNVLRGDMSLIGPRPERPHFAGPLAGAVPGYAERHRVRGGITGLAQVRGYWGNTSIDERTRLDNRYIDAWNIRRDVAILVRTLPAVVRKARS